MSSDTRGENGRLPKSTLGWSLRSIVDHGSNSLYRNPFEFGVFEDHAEALTKDLSELRVDFFRWSEPRKMVIPKDPLSFRLAAQLDPVDDIILMSIVKLIGKRIEARRLADDIAFSHRYVNRGEILYRRRNGWAEFWQVSKARAEKANFVVRADISDFYSQIPHSEVLSQLALCEAPSRLCSAVENFLRTFGGEHRRGLPIGPHAAHLLAELSLVRADNLLTSRGHEFTRYIDDYHLFCPDEKSAHLALFDLAELVRSEFGLALNRGKTAVLPAGEFIEKAKEATREESPEEREEAILQVIDALTENNDFYMTIDLEEAYEQDPDAFSEDAIEGLLEARLEGPPVDYKHLAWLLRRLAQIGPPGGIPFVLENFEKFVPVVGDAANYERRVAEIKTLVKKVLERAAKEGSTALLLGDLNVVGPGDPTMAPLTKAGIALAEPYLEPTNAARDKFYTQIAFRPTQDGPRLRRAGVFPVFDIVFREEDQEHYLQEMEASKAWDTSQKRSGKVDPEVFYGKWRTYQMSDHLPVWTELSV